jgi:hypothetical protein
MKAKWFVLLMVGVWVTSVNINAAVLFSDSFNRADSLDIDADSAGMGGSLGPLTYVEIGDDQIYPIQSGTGNPYPELTQVKDNQLYMAYGTNMSTMYLNHNFVDEDILTAGGMRIGLTIAQNMGPSTTNQFFVGFGVGNTLQECENIWFDHNGTGFRGQLGTPSQTGVSDFWIGWSPANNGTIQVLKNGPTAKGGENYNLLTGVSLTGSDRLELELLFNAFTDGSIVNANILWNGEVIGTDSFAWDADGLIENYIGINGRQGVGFIVDNLEIATIPEPITLTLLALGSLVTLRRRG